jgi:single-strand DNA-binding protein
MRGKTGQNGTPLSPGSVWQRLWANTCAKVSKLYIERKLQTSSWEDKQSGERKYRTEIVARDIVLLGSRDNGQEGGGEMPSGQSSPEPAPAVADDVPF